MINLLRGLVYFVVLVLIQALILNNIHFLRIATPFLYLYFIIKMPVGTSGRSFLFPYRPGDRYVFKYPRNACGSLYAGRIYP